MDLADRIARRRSRRTEDRLVVNWDALNPSVHLSEPVGRESLFEVLLNEIDPVFDSTLPPNVYVWGPAGSGKSAIVSALVETLAEEFSSQQMMYTATRGGSDMSGMRFVYIDGRQAPSQFQVYRQALNTLRSEHIPKRGVGTSELHDQLESTLTSCDGVVVAVDHLNESGTMPLEEVYGYFEAFENIVLLGVGRTPPGDLPISVPEAQVHVPRYSYELVDILTARATRGLSRALDHTHVSELAEWADGDAHDALGALFIAAHHAQTHDRTQIGDGDLAFGMGEINRDGVPIGEVLTLSDNKQRVLKRLVELPDDKTGSIESAAEAIGEQSELTSGTVKRLLYELAQLGILRRVEISVGGQMAGRKPSKVTENFSPTLFERLYEH